MNTFAIECWTCRKQAAIDGPEPQYAVDVMQAASVAGFLSSIDFKYSRTLVFCSPRCREKALMKNGAFRKFRPKTPVHNGGNQ